MQENDDDAMNELLEEMELEEGGEYGKISILLFFVCRNTWVSLVYKVSLWSLIAKKHWEVHFLKNCRPCFA